MSYLLVETDNDREWDEYVSKTAEASVFNTSLYLKTVGESFKRYFVIKGKSKKAALLVSLSPDGKNIRLATFVIYGGLFYFDEDSDQSQNRYKILSSRFEITEFVVSELTQKFENIRISFSPFVTDIRPFLWFNYHEPDDNQKFKVHLRYTSYLDISQIHHRENEFETDAFLNLSMSRRQEIRYARKDDIQAFLSDDATKFLDLAKSAYAKRTDDSELLKREFQTMSRLIPALIKNKQGRLYLVKNKSDDIVSGSFFGLDQRRAYFLFATNHPENKERYSGTMAVWDALRDLNQLGVNEVDLEGINSPKRGWFKQSFGGDIRPYYQVELKRK